MKGKIFLRMIKDKILQHPLFDDPFVRTISSLEHFDIVYARKFATLYYPHILRTRLYQANTLGITLDENIQFVLAQILHDEYGSGDINLVHAEKYRNFLRAVDVDLNTIDEFKIIPELDMYIQTMMRLTQSSHWLEAVAAVGIASEWPIPKLYRQFLNGLRKIPGINDDDLELFIEHMDLDVEHSSQIEEALLPYLDDKESQVRVERGVQVNLDSRRVFHSGLYREVFK